MLAASIVRFFYNNHQLLSTIILILSAKNYTELAAYKDEIHVNLPSYAVSKTKAIVADEYNDYR